MTNRRSRGASRSSNCFQTSSAFGFLFFMVRSRKEVDSPDGIVIFDRQLTVHRQEKGQRLNTENTEKKVDSSDGIGIFNRPFDCAQGKQLTVHRQKKGQRLNTSASPEENAAPKRKRAKPRLSRRFTRKAVYHKD